MKFLLASEARELTRDSLASNYNFHIEEINSQVRLMASFGKTSFRYNFGIRNAENLIYSVILQYKQAGYKVKRHFIDTDVITISWE